MEKHIGNFDSGFSIHAMKSMDGEHCSSFCGMRASPPIRKELMNPPNLEYVLCIPCRRILTDDSKKRDNMEKRSELKYAANIVNMITGKIHAAHGVPEYGLTFCGIGEYVLSDSARKKPDHSKVTCDPCMKSLIAGGYIEKGEKTMKHPPYEQEHTGNFYNHKTDVWHGVPKDRTKTFCGLRSMDIVKEVVDGEPSAVTCESCKKSMVSKGIIYIDRYKKWHGDNADGAKREKEPEPNPIPTIEQIDNNPDLAYLIVDYNLHFFHDDYTIVDTWSELEELLLEAHEEELDTPDVYILDVRKLKELDLNVSHKLKLEE